MWQKERKREGNPAAASPKFLNFMAGGGGAPEIV